MLKQESIVGVKQQSIVGLRIFAYGLAAHALIFFVMWIL